MSFCPLRAFGYNFLSSFCRRYATGVLEHARKKCCHLPVLVAEAMKIGHFFAKKLHVCNNQPSCFLSSVREKLQICNKYFFHLFTSSARSVDTRTKKQKNSYSVDRVLFFTYWIWHVLCYSIRERLWRQASSASSPHRSSTKILHIPLPIPFGGYQ